MMIFLPPYPLPRSRNGIYPFQTVGFTLLPGLDHGAYLCADILQNPSGIKSKASQTPVKRVMLANLVTPPQTPVINAGPSSAPPYATCERPKISFSDALARVRAKSASFSEPSLSCLTTLLIPYVAIFPATPSGPPEPPAAQDKQQPAGLSMPPSSTSIQGVKRSSNGIGKLT
jgi:hypothetical protein